MPTYDYRCTATGRVVEVQHRMSEQAVTWGELCALAGIEPGDTPSESPVTRLATGGNVVTNAKLGSGTQPPCGGGGCAGGMCAFE